MMNPPCLQELKHDWLPHVTDSGLDRIIDLLEKGSPLLIHGTFARAVPMGCLATHIAWHHPQTCEWTMEAGVKWLNQVAGLNPATSQVIQAWDAKGVNDWELRCDLLCAFKEERELRQATHEHIEQSECELALA